MRLEHDEPPMDGPAAACEETVAMVGRACRTLSEVGVVTMKGGPPAPPAGPSSGDSGRGGRGVASAYAPTPKAPAAAQADPPSTSRGRIDAAGAFRLAGRAAGQPACAGRAFQPLGGQEQQHDLVGVARLRP